MVTKKTTRKTTARKTAAKTTKKSSSSAAKKAPQKKKAGKKKTTAKRSAKKADNGAILVEREIGGRMLSLETGRMAKLADGAVIARYGDTMVLATAQSAGARDDIDFFPLTVDYREKAAAGGKFPGGFFKREGRPTTRETLTCRVIDRSIRPMFADGFRCETQVLSQVLSTDRENDSDIVAAIGSFAALAVSSIPNGKTLGAVRIGLRDDKLIINPTWTQLQSEENELNLTVSGHSDAIVMVEAGAKQVSEEVILEAMDLAHEVCCEVADMIDELVGLAGKTKIEVTPPTGDGKLEQDITKKFGKQLMQAPIGGRKSKFERGAQMKAAKTAVREAFPAPNNATEKEAAAHKKQVSTICTKLIKKGERRSILDGVRADGRSTDEIRPIHIEVGVLPRVHGSALFTRGETQALCTATLGTQDDRQYMDGIYPEPRKSWLLHYAFPPFSVGEVRRFLAPGRREIGHGALAERAVEVVLPAQDEFSYSLRVTSEILESNGSSSMASVCGATLALMDAGVPISQPVAGIAMGLVVEGRDVAILSDILGSEDGCGDMDFKCAGTGKGITALQMDIKCEGLARETLEEAMEQARIGRLHILRIMLDTIRKPRATTSEYAPRLISLQVPKEKIGAIIGPMGRNIRALQEEFECRISIGDEGQVEIAGTDAPKVDACVERISMMTADVEIGQVYKGKVTGVKEFGAFVEILPGQEGLVHVSELSAEFIRSVTDVVSVGDEIEVKVIEIDDFGKVKLSRRALLTDAGSGEGSDRAPRGRTERNGEDRPRRPRREAGEERPRRPRREEGEDRPRHSNRGEEGEARPRRPRREEGEDRPRREESEDRPRRSSRDDGDRPRSSSRDDRPRSSSRDDEDRPRRSSSRDDRPRSSSRDDEDRPRRSSSRDDRPRGSSSDDEDRPRRSSSRDDRPRSGSRDDGDRPRRSNRDDEDRPRSGSRDDGDRPRRSNRDDEDRPRRSSRDDEDRPSSSSRDEEDRPRRSPQEGPDDDAPRRSRRPRSRR